MRRKLALKSSLLLLLIFSWFFSGWPMSSVVPHWPPEIDQAQAITITTDFSVCSPDCDSEPQWWASGDDIDVFPFAGNTANRNTHSEVTDTDYTAMQASDDSRYATANPGSGDENFLWFEMPVNEDPATVAQINFTFEGYPNSAVSDFTIWLKTADGAYETDASWFRVSGPSNFATGTDSTITGSISGNIADYINNDGVVVWGVWQEESADSVSIDYVKMDVLHFPIEQEGFRFRADDGSETTATWLAAQDTNITRDISTNTRLRMLLSNTDSVADSAQYRLEYKKSSDSNYRKVVTENGFPVVEGVVNGGSGPANSFTHPITMPPGIRPGELLLIVFSIDAIPTVSIDSGGWTKLEQASYTTITTGAIFYKIAEGNDSAIVTSSGGEQSSHVVYRISGAGVPTGTSLANTGTNTAVPNHDAGSAQNYLWIVTRSGDGVVSATSPPTNYTNLQTWTSSSATGANTNTAQRNLNASSEDPDIWINDSEQAVTYTLAIPPSSEAIVLADSTNITTSGESTTAQLAAPSGKTTSDFVAGRIQDDENPADSVTITDSDYTEMEWNLKATSNAVNDDIYQFRVTHNGKRLTTYTLTPQWTIGAGASASISLTTDGVVSYGILGFGESKSTLDLTDTQTVSNDGDDPIDVNIKTSVATGGTGWTLGSSPGSDIFVHEFSSNGGSNWTPFSTADAYQTLVTSLASSATQNFDLRLTAPDPGTDTVEKAITITIQAVAE